MYDSQQIKDELIGLVGWRQNIEPTEWQLTDMLTSSTGLYFNDVHPLLTIDNFRSICPQFDCLTTNPNQSEINDLFTNWLKEKTESGIINAIDAWYNQKFEKGTAKNLLRNDKLFNVTGNFSDLEITSNKVVGIELVPPLSSSVMMHISKIGLQFDTNQTIRLNLFKTGNKEPVSFVDVDYQGNGSIQWQPITWSLSDKQGSYYIAYDQNLLQGNAINGIRTYNYNAKGLTSFPTGRYFKATAFNVDVPDMVELWDLKKNNYSLTTNYGLNLCFSVKCDYTDFIIEQKELFKSVVSLEVGIRLLKELAYNANTRVNRNESNIDRSQILYALEGDTQGKNSHSLVGQLKLAYDAISFDNTGIDKICLPCRKRGITFKAIGPR